MKEFSRLSGLGCKSIVVQTVLAESMQMVYLVTNFSESGNQTQEKKQLAVSRCSR